MKTSSLLSSGCIFETVPRRRFTDPRIWECLDNFSDARGKWPCVLEARDIILGATMNQLLEGILGPSWWLFNDQVTTVVL